MRKEIVVVDGFYDDPEGIREFALNQNTLIYKSLNIY